MLKLLLPLLIYPAIPILAQNLIIDVSKSALQEYVSSMSYHFASRIPGKNLPEMEETRFICGVSLKNAKISNVSFKNLSAELAGPYQDYFFNITDLSFTISGPYIRNFLFFKFHNSYSIKVNFKTVSLGAIVPTFSNGFPFIHGVINCDFIGQNVDDPVTSGWFVSSMIKSAVSENINSILCHRLVETLDGKIRDDIHNLQMDFPIFANTSEMSYRMFKKAPSILPSKQIRYFVEGEIEEPINEPALFLAQEVADQRHVAYHIHEKLLAEMLDAICEKGLFDSNFTSIPSMKPVSYLCLNTSVKISELSNAITIIIHIMSLETYADDQEKSQLRSFMVTPLHNSEHELFIRLKSQLANRWLDNTFTEQLFNHLSTVLSDNFRLPLPFIQSSSISNVVFLPRTDYFSILSDFDFHTESQ